MANCFRFNAIFSYPGELMKTEIAWGIEKHRMRRETCIRNILGYRTSEGNRRIWFTRRV